MEGWEKAFVLHHRAYGESSLLLDVLLEEKGRMALIAKGAKRKRSELKAILQPFTPLFLRYSPRGGQLKSLIAAESASLPFPLNGKHLYCGFYINELLLKTLPEGPLTTPLFFEYLQCLQALSRDEAEIERVLRLFEFSLLEELGYLTNFTHCYQTEMPIQSEAYYRFIGQEGFSEVLPDHTRNLFLGKHLHDFQQRDFSSQETRQAAKRFTRTAFQFLLGTTPLKSRELFKK